MLEQNVKKLKKAETHKNSLVTDALNYTPISRTRRNRPKTAINILDNT